MTPTILADNEVRAEPAPAREVRADAPATFRRVVVGVDGTSSGRDAIALGESLRDTDGRLTLAHVVLTQRPVYGNFHTTGAGQKTREMLAREREATEVSAELTGMFAPSVGWGLRRLAREIDADLVVVGASRRGPIARLLRGDDARGTLSGATCAVAVAPPGYAPPAKPIKTIGVAYDGSPEADAALVAARMLAAHHGAAVLAATAVWPTMVSPAARWLPLAGPVWALLLDAHEDEVSEQLHALTGVDGRVVVGPAATELLEFAGDVDLLVVGSRDHGRLRRLLLGSTSAYLARRAPSPLLVVPPHRSGE